MPLGITTSVPSALTSVARVRIKRRQDQANAGALQGPTNALQMQSGQLAPPSSELDQHTTGQTGTTYGIGTGTASMGDERTPTNDPVADAAKERAKDAAKEKAKEKARQAALDKISPTESALLDDIASRRAKLKQDVASTSGLAGMGLSGASATLQADSMRAFDRNATLERADFKAREDANDFAEIKRRAAIDDYEATIGEDVDGDGDIAGKTPAEIKEENINRHRNEKGGSDDEETPGYWSRERDPEGGPVNPDDARRAADWPGDSPLVGFNIGHDDEYNYVLGVDGKIWRVPHSGNG